MKIKMLSQYKTQSGKVIGPNEKLNVREVSNGFGFDIGYQVTDGLYIGEIIPRICALKLHEDRQQHPIPSKRQYDDLKEMSETALAELEQMTQARNQLQEKVKRLEAEKWELRTKYLRARIINIVDCSADPGDAADTLLILIEEERKSSAS